MIDDYDIFRAAHEKDYGPLVDLLRSDAVLLPRHRELIIKILERKIARPRHRKADTLQDIQRRHAIAKFVHDLQASDCKKTAAIAEAMDKFGCSEGTVKNALRNHRLGEEVMQSVAQILRHQGIAPGRSPGGHASAA